MKFWIVAGGYLGEIDPEFADGRIDLSFFDTAVEAIGNQIGKELVIQFVAFGDTEEETFENLTRVFAMSGMHWRG